MDKKAEYSDEFAHKLTRYPSIALLGHAILGTPFVQEGKATDCKRYLAVLDAFVQPLVELHRKLGKDADLEIVRQKAEPVALAILQRFRDEVEATQYRRPGDPPQSGWHLLSVLNCNDMGAHQEAVRLLRRVPVSSEDRETAAMINCVQGVFSTVFYDEETRISYPQDSDDEDFDLSKDPHDCDNDPSADSWNRDSTKASNCSAGNKSSVDKDGGPAP